jgi:hypothetical protein
MDKASPTRFTFWAGRLPMFTEQAIDVQQMGQIHIQALQFAQGFLQGIQVATSSWMRASPSWAERQVFQTPLSQIC